MGWRRVGERIAYYENHFETENGQSYYTLTFSLTFPHANDVCYLAHCFPYSYSDMSSVLAEVMSKPNASRILKMSTLCTTLVGNKCPLLTVTNFSSSPDAIARRRGICISARVHPGETCASWTMHGLIEFICGNSPRARCVVVAWEGVAAWGSRSALMVVVAAGGVHPLTTKAWLAGF